MRSIRDDRGAIAIVVAVFAVVMFAFGALVVDLGIVRSTRLEARAAVDAAALASAARLYDEPSTVPQFPQAVAEAKRLAAANFGTTGPDWAAARAACDPTVPAGWVEAGSGTSCIVFDDATRPTKVQVVLPARRTTTAFGGVVDFTGLDVTARAQAQVVDSSIRDCSLCVSGFLDVDGSVAVDGNGSVMADDGSVGSAGSIAVVGGGVIGFADPPSPASGPRYSPDPVVPIVPTDPFAGRPMPPPASTTDFSRLDCDGAGDLRSDVLYRHVRVEGPCVLPAGTVYISGNLRFRNRAGATLTGAGSTLYFTCRPDDDDDDDDEDGDPVVAACDPGQTGGSLVVRAGRSMNLAGTGFGGFAVLYHPNNRASMVVDGTLNATGGSIYKRVGSSSVSVGTAGRLDVNGGLMSVNALTVRTGGRVEVTASGLGSRPGPARLALAE